MDKTVGSLVLSVLGSLGASFLVLLGQRLIERRGSFGRPLLTSPLIVTLIGSSTVFLVSYQVVQSTIETSLIMGLVVALIIALANIMTISARERALKALSDILGAVDWSSSTAADRTAGGLLKLVSKNFKFFGMGFNKFTEYGGTDDCISLEKVVEECYRVAPRDPIQVMVMNPFCEQVAEYEAKRSRMDNRSTTQKIMESLVTIEQLRSRGYNIEVRFYPHSMNAVASFRLFFVDDNTVFVGFYKFRDEGYGVPQIQLTQRGDSSFYRPFSELRRYLWENGEDADYYRLYYPLSTDDLRGRHNIERTREYLRECAKRYYPRTRLEDLRICLAALSGRDSVAAIKHAIDSRAYSMIIPVIISIPTEYGRGNPRLETIKKIRKYSDDTLAVNGCVVAGTIMITDNGLWGKISGSHQLHEFGACSPCIGCHFYIHAIRCHLAKELEISDVVSGDREAHGTVIKVNQLPEILDAFQQFAEQQYGVSLHFPLRYMKDDKEVREILGFLKPFNGGIEDLHCHFGGSASAESGNIPDSALFVKMINECLIPEFISEMR